MKNEDMLSFVEVANAGEVLDLLRKFDPVFPHMKEKVSDYETFAEKIVDHAVVCVARTGAQTCGMVVFYANDFAEKVAYISLLGLLPEWQGRRLGCQLLNYCCEYAREKGMIAIRLEVDLDNSHAITFYEKNGFIPYGEKMLSSIYMEKMLI